MLHNVIAAGQFGSTILDWIEVASLVIEIVAVTIIVVATLYAVGRFFLGTKEPGDKDARYHILKVSLARSLLLGLEVLVAADVVRTVALEATFQAVSVLGLLVLIRIALSWSLIVEIEGRWPWQSRPSAHAEEPPAGEPVQAA